MSIFRKSMIVFYSYNKENKTFNGYFLFTYNWLYFSNHRVLSEAINQIEKETSPNLVVTNVKIID